MKLTFTDTYKKFNKKGKAIPKIGTALPKGR
jgi:hypothetical protein